MLHSAGITAPGPARSGAEECDEQQKWHEGSQSEGGEQSRAETMRRGSALLRLQGQQLFPSQHVKIKNQFGRDSRHVDTTRELQICLAFITFN